MTDQILAHSDATSENLLVKWICHLTSFFRNEGDKVVMDECLDMSPVDRARLERGLPLSKRLMCDVGQERDYSCDTVRDDTIDIASRHGIPL